MLIASLDEVIDVNLPSVFDLVSTVFVFYFKKDILKTVCLFTLSLYE